MDYAITGKDRGGRGPKDAHEIIESLEEESSDHTIQEKGPSYPLDNQQDSPLNQVKAAESLRDDVSAIVSMFSNETPPEIGICSLEIFLAVYGFGDASGKGCGLAVQGNNGISYQIGVWAENESDESSNWREFFNCILALEEEAERENLKGREVFFFTDNTTVEACCYKGSSSSKRLLDLIIRLQATEMKHLIKLHQTHVSGKRIIAQGTHRLSRGAIIE
ncbi:hypothetical protein ACA910_017539 [Epithemia clementina (nom. ined.)]